MLWAATGLFFLLMGVGQAFAGREFGRPEFAPDLDLVLVLVVALFARRERVTPLLLLLACTRASLTGTPLAAASAAFLAVGWLLASSRHLLFRDRFPGRLILGLLGAGGVRGLLAGLAFLGRGVALPGAGELAEAAALTALWFLLLLPLLCRLPPLSLHLERSRV